ncbi:HAD family hydrolase (plasmid) [Paenibacillus thiaminolyticus]|uniref:HAD family hydrolase n=1 Tax=Paenibacillus thiaminolyticus TaxID=49283 RepID=UPI002330955D|nr:HAD family hydrolase [Paenibacillus thiaminolyticus]WCF11603.1 HAD family hydrolase [Paenibacillus thiaminolyticus]
MKENKLLIWDLDDTLIITNPEYEKTNQDCAEIIADELFADFKQIIEISNKQRKIDLELISQYGFVRPRYLQSWIQTYIQLCNENGKNINHLIERKLTDAIENLYVRKCRNMPNSIDVLQQLKNEGYEMVVLTAGEDDVQRKRVDDAGMSKYMDAIYVYNYKTPCTLKEVLGKYPGKSHYMIGNSLRSDIYPALSNGIHGIHVIRDTWEADHYEIDSNHRLYHSVHSLREIPSLLRNIQSIAA